MLTLDYAGVPTYVLTLTKELQRRGHRVAVHCPPSQGRRPLEGLLPVVKDLSEVSPLLEGAPDAMIAYHTPLAAPMRRAFPSVPLLFSAHGLVAGAEPPDDIRVDRFIAINELVAATLAFTFGISRADVSLVRDFVDTDRFRPRSSLREKPRVLFLSNYKKWRNYYMIVDACKALGLQFKAVGVPYGRSPSVDEDINQADLVISWGRGIIEAMACGRAVVSFDQIKFNKEDLYSQVIGDGYLTPERYLAAREHNFGARGCRRLFQDWRQLADELSQYDPACSEVNRGLALEHHGHVAGVDNVLEAVGMAKVARAA